jgi:hypothetical protein
MKVFISYNSKQLNLAENIRDFLDSVSIDSFIANDDLRTGANWKKAIISELEKCELFIPLLSKEFKISDWCSQEIGIAYIKNMGIVPVSIDDTKPYGFINHIQARFVNKMDIALIIAEGLMECNNMNNASGFIKLLKDAGSFRRSEEIYKALEPFFDKLKIDDLNLVISCSIANAQIWSASSCLNKYIPKLLKLRKDDIDRLLIKKLKYQIKNGKWYPERNV